MSTKDGSLLGKPLKGGKGANKQLDFSDILSLLSKGGSISGMQLENVSIFSGDLDDVNIGGVVPSDGNFKNLTVGIRGQGGTFKVLGSNSDINDNPIDYMEWDKIGGILNIFGSLTIRDSTRLGNIIIRDNDIVAVNTDGDINLIPQSSNASIFLAGNMRQSVASAIEFNLATNFSVLSSNNQGLIAKNDTLLGSRDGIVTISSDIYKDSKNITSMIYNVSGSIINTSTQHQLEVGQQVEISDTGIAGVDGLYTVSQVLSSTIFKVVIPTLFGTITGTGLLQAVRDGVVNILGGTSVKLRDGIPLVFGDLSRPSITNSQEDLLVSGRNIIFKDPIITLQTESGLFSDSGIAIKYVSGIQERIGFLGFVNSTENLTYIPNATITNTATGKSVTGQRGTMELEAVVVNRIGGNPNLIIDAPLGTITVNTLNTVFPNNSPITIGTTGSILSNGSNLLISTTNTGGKIILQNETIVTQGTALSFSSTSIQTIKGTSNGLTITSSIINLEGLLNLSVLQFNLAGNTIYNTGNDLFIKATSNLVLQPANSLVLPENVFFRIGDTIGTGLYGANGAIFWSTTTDTNISSDRYINLTSLAGRIYINSSQIFYTSNTEFLFGSNHSLSTLQIGGRNTLSLSSSDLFQVNALEIRLESPKIVVANNNLLCIGDGGSELHYSTTDDTLYLNSEKLNIQSQVVINGSLIVNGPSTIIKSNVTVFDDPVIRLGGQAPVGDVKSRGFDFVWFDNLVQKVGFLGLNQQEKRFILSLNGTTTNDIHTPIDLGDLLLNKLVASGIETNTFTTNILQGNPDLQLIADDIYLSATNQIKIPIGTLVTSGSTRFGATTNSTFIIDSPVVSIPSSSLNIGQTELVMTDLNTFRIRNVQTIFLEGNVNISSSLSFGNTGVTISVDNQNNIIFTSLLGGDTIFSGTAVLDGGMDMGNATMTWSSTSRPGGEIVWGNILPNTELNVSLLGNIFDATWYGNPVTIDYGGTGHVGQWTPRSIVFVGDSVLSLEEDPLNFTYNHTLQTFGVRTSNPLSTITIGSGDVDHLGNNGHTLYRHDSFLRFAVGKTDRHFVIAGTPLSGITAKSVLNPYLIVNPHGQVGIGMSTPFMDGLQGLPTEAKLYVSGNIRLEDPNYGIYFSNTEYINGSNQSLSFYSANAIRYNANVVFGQNVYFFDESSLIYGQVGGILNISTSNILNLTSPTVVIDNCLCLHYNSFTSQCETYLKRNETNASLDIVNFVGDIFLNPATSIVIPDNKDILLGTNGILSVTPNEMRFTVNTGDVSFSSNNVNILNGSNLVLFSPSNTSDTTNIYQSVDGLVVENINEIFLNTPKVRLPIGSSLWFGSEYTRVTSTLTSLDLFGIQMINLSSPNINIRDGSLLNFYSPILPNTFSSIYQTDSQLIITGTLPLLLATSRVELPNNTPIIFGDSFTRISSVPGVLQLFGTNSISLESPIVNIQDGATLCFHAPSPFITSSCIYQTEFELVIQGNFGISLLTQNVTLPHETSITFGDSTKRITSTLNSIEIYSPDLINIISNNVRITGNLVVDKKSSFTIEAETSFDSGILDLGGAQMLDITLLGTYSGSNTLVTVNAVHSLVVGDYVTIFDSIPNLDGSYQVLDIPTPTTFSINTLVPFTGIPVGSVAPYGRIRSLLIQDPDNDVGIQINWHKGTSTGTTFHRTGFFGFRRSTQCFVYIPEATRIGNKFFGDYGDICGGTITASTGINTPNLLGPLYTNGYQVSGSNFIINGGAINNSIIGNVVPNQGYFTNIFGGTLQLSNGICAPNLLCNLNTSNYQVSGTNFFINGGSINNTPIGNNLPSTASFTQVTANTLELVTGLCAPTLLCDLYTSTYQVSGSNFIINGGAINGTSIGTTVPSVAYFTTVNTGSLVVTNNVLVANLNADLLDGYHSTFFITIDGNTSLVNNWNAGSFRITTAGITDTTLYQTGIVYAGVNGILLSKNVFSFNDTTNTLFVPSISTSSITTSTLSGFSVNGDVNINGNQLTNALVRYSDIQDSNVTISPTFTLDVSQGSVIFANDQLSGNYISGGVANIDISGQSATVVNGLYTTDFANNTILKADTSNNPITLVVPERSVIGRIENGVIDAISFDDLSTFINPTWNYVPNSILFADSTTTIPLNVAPLVVPFSTFVGRRSSGEITALTPEEARDVLQIQPVTEQEINDNGGILKTGHLNYPDGGTMTGLLFTSFERFPILSGESRNLDVNVETSYIMVNYSIIGGRIATCTLNSGIADGHRKLVIISSMANKSVLKLDCNFVSVDTVNPESFLFITSGQSIMLQWDTVMNAWFPMNTGAIVLTQQDIENPNWLEELTGENDDINVDE